MLLCALLSIQSSPLIMNNGRQDVYACPSFSSYSSNKSAEIAVEKYEEDGASGQNNAGDDDDFEFVFVREDREVSAEDLFSDAQIGPIFPVFNRDLLLNSHSELSTSSGNELSESSVAVPLSKLFIQEDHERVDPPSCSSSEADELENVPARTYCVWRPKKADSPSPPLPSQCKKSKSTGSVSKRWKLRDLLWRSNSDGKGSFVFLTPKHREEKSEKSIQEKIKGVRAASGFAPASPSAHEALYIRNRAMKEGEKKKSYLPYRRDLVGFFAGLPRGFPSF